MALTRAAGEPLPDILDAPQLRLIGDIEYDMVGPFLDQLADAVDKGGDIAVQVTTIGGDAEAARRLVLAIDQARPRIKGRFLFLGQTTVQSAGVTLMAAFPRADRYLSRDTRLLIHGRELEKTIELTGAIRSSRPKLEALLREFDMALDLEREGFERLVKDSRVSAHDLCEKSATGWFLTAAEAETLGLVAGLV